MTERQPGRLHPTPMLPTPHLVAIAAGATSNQLVEDLSGVGLAEPETSSRRGPIAMPPAPRG
jgi:hypothetical protein